uniref:heme exporter protein CcmD n=1 Tax=Castellaniella defragrans TaxID=75697 RepID=UPI0033418D9F
MSEFFEVWWGDWASFLRMGRHGVYVWSSVAVVIVALAGEQWMLMRRARRARAGASGESV